ncbi:MAG TPA: extracellular solute-binding protein [Thermotogota bacterium]|nr:extracellular solute-binding protein [Thermotogota bacterium]HRW92449.1 extracellular solute-binding protein [Thermotogota bacterium]
MKKLLFVFLAIVFSMSLFAATINILAWDDAYTRSLKELLPEFEKATGHKVNLELIPSGSMLEKTALGVQARSTNYDLVTIDEGNVARFGSLLLPYADWPNGKTYQKITPEEISAALFDAATWGGVIKGMPINANAYVWMTREDIVNNPEYQAEFKAMFGYDFQVPQTLDQLMNMAIFLQGKGIFGWAPFTKSTEGSTCEAILFFEAFGTSFMEMVDGKYQVVLDREKAIQAILFYKELLQYAPPGALDYGHSERIAAYNQGRVFSMFQWPGIVPSHENPEESLVAGKSIYSAPPAGPQKRAAVRGVWIIGIPSASKQAQAAAEFVYWWGSKATGEQLVEAGQIPFRKDLLGDPALIASKPWFKGIGESSEFAVSRPNKIEYYPEVSDMIKLSWLAGVSGQLSAEQAVDKMIADVQAVIAKHE